MSAEDTLTIIQAADRIAQATRVTLALNTLAESWEAEAATAKSKAWHSTWEAHRAYWLSKCAEQLRETVGSAAENTATCDNRKD